MKKTLVAVIVILIIVAGAVVFKIIKLPTAERITIELEAKYFPDYAKEIKKNIEIFVPFERFKYHSIVVFKGEDYKPTLLEKGSTLKTTLTTLRNKFLRDISTVDRNAAIEVIDIYLKSIDLAERYATHMDLISSLQILDFNGIGGYCQKYNKIRDKLSDASLSLLDFGLEQENINLESSNISEKYSFLDNIREMELDLNFVISLEDSTDIVEIMGDVDDICMQYFK